MPQPQEYHPTFSHRTSPVSWLNPFFWLAIVWRQSKRFLTFTFRPVLTFLFRRHQPKSPIEQPDLEGGLSQVSGSVHENHDAVSIAPLPNLKLLSVDSITPTKASDAPSTPSTTALSSPTSSTVSSPLTARTSPTSETATAVELEDVVADESDEDSENEDQNGPSEKEIRAAILNAKTPEEIPELMGRIHSVESMSAVDGPGLRYLVFTQGCPRKCVFCQNRDTWDITEGHDDSTKRLSVQIKKCVPYLKPNNGGVTLSGGEPLMQPLITGVLFKEAKLMGLTTCLDTTGFGSKKDWDLVLPNTDYVLLCLKSFDPDMYKKITSNNYKAAFAFAEELKQRGIKFWLRYVMLPGWTDNEFEYNKIIEFSHSQPTCQGVELLPYHRLGAQKWDRMGHEYPLDGVDPPSREDVLAVKQKFIEAGVKVLCSY